MEEVIIGVDVGGTSIKIGVFKRSGELIDKTTIPTNKNNQGHYIVDDIWATISIKIKKLHLLHQNILGIGVGVPGFIDAHEGIVKSSGNIGWKNYPMTSHLESVSRLPVLLENDANAAVIGEHWLGAGRGADPLFMITLGTGIGGGIVVKGNIVRGMNHMAGEIGHYTVEQNGLLCSCGRRGCLETIASATGIVKRAYALMEVAKHQNDTMVKGIGQNYTLTAKDVFDLAMNGDSICMQVIDEAAQKLGFVFANVSTIINPSKIIIGGGVSNAGKQLIDLINDWFKYYSLPRVYEQCTIQTAQLGNDAGIYGAANLVKMVYKTK